MLFAALFARRITAAVAPLRRTHAGPRCSLHQGTLAGRTKGDGSQRAAVPILIRSPTNSSARRTDSVPYVTISGMRKCIVDETVFDELTPAACYVIGLLASDGCVGGADPRRISIKLAAEDAPILRTVKRFLRTDATLGTHPARGNSRPQVGIQIRSTRLVQRLTELGIGPRKSLSLQIKHALLLESPHFWRGVVDGDGTVMVAKHSKRSGKTYLYPRIQLVSGSKIFIDQFVAFLDTHDIRASVLDAPTQAPGKTHRIYTCVVNNQADVVRLARLLYAECGVYALTRKKMQARTIIAMFRHAPKRKPIITTTMRDEIVRRYVRDRQSSSSIAVALGLTTTAVTNALKAASVSIRSKSGNHAAKQYSEVDIIDTYGSVLSTRATAALLELSRDTVRKVLKAHGIL